ncbi:hypothetical protein [Streptomyces chattanoogensis]|uniref:Uncharacterized protein n=1 Tax=Streptomyces chattanoogensis TaxID=66876 RepID=A0A0N0Y0C7_9ACTN|nr:hypothetical protein [Streptomyces chattanoogensis]KPC67045.1 hypothetical protein ADL29_02410 [Streptomyces chattanoogensis]
MTHRPADRVEYRDDKTGEMQQGKIMRAEGSGQKARYTIQNERTNQLEEIQERQIERDLQ